MRRVWLAVYSVGIGGVMLAVFCTAVAWQCTSVQAAQVQQLPAAVLSYPCTVKDTPMEVEDLVWYEGPFWEDGSQEEVTAVAALVVKNTGCLFVASGAVILEWDGARYVFELEDLPPGQQVLVLEKDRQPCRKDPPRKCYGWSREEYPEIGGQVTVEESGGSMLTIVNHSTDTVPVVQVTFKSCDRGSGLLLGGISYLVEVRDLRPGERRQVCPYHYAYGSSRVIKTILLVET